MQRLVSLSAAALLLAGCASVNKAANEVGDTVSDVANDINPPRASARLLDASGRQVGTAAFAQHDNAVEIDVKVTGLPAGAHGIHLHETGSCTPPAFTSAGGHFNPMGRQHGLDNPNGPHAGDMPNLVVNADGTGQLKISDDRVTLTPGARSLFDADGTALVIHAGPDDQRTDPAGNSGARIACGVVEK